MVVNIKSLTYFVLFDFLIFFIFNIFFISVLKEQYIKKQFTISLSLVVNYLPNLVPWVQYL